MFSRIREAWNVVKKLWEPDQAQKPKQCESEEDCRTLFENLPVWKVAHAEFVLRQNIPLESWKKISATIEKFGKDWLYHLYDDKVEEARKLYGDDFESMGWAGTYAGMGHFGFGMQVRNLLRNKGCGEDYFRIANLDDIYVQLLEGAAKGAALDVLLREAVQAA